MKATEWAQPPMMTVGDLMRTDDVPRHVIEYAIEAYGIRETQRAGIIRLYDADGVRRIRSALRRIAERRGGSL